jgi:glucosamine--fructose-6-phosphate aminotransferase (isomerizing)
MLIARNGSPLLVGLHETGIFIASERVAFEKYTTNYVALEDGEVHLLDLTNRKQFYTLMQSRTCVIKETQDIQLKPLSCYGSFYEQEIYQQPEAILKVMGNGGRLSNSMDNTKLGGLEMYSDNISNIDNMVLIGCGSSLYSGMFGARIFKLLECFNSVQCIEASEFSPLDLPYT